MILKIILIYLKQIFSLDKNKFIKSAFILNDSIVYYIYNQTILY